MESLIRESTLPTGLRIVTEQVPGVQSAAFGVWVGAGSRDEPADQMGSAHFLEHLLFKGTSGRDALTISSLIEAVGGDLNAYTTKEYTCFYARVLGRDLGLAIDVVCDVVTDALLTENDIEAERAVILEEIAMVEDEPSDVVHDVFAHQLFGDNPLGRPILGNIATITTLPNAAIRAFYRERYRASHMVVAAAGALDHDVVVEQVARAFGESSEGPMSPAQPRAAGHVALEPPGVRLVTRPLEQANVVLGVPGLTRSDPRKYALAVLATALGGGMSSSLFQEIRERRGLAYSVYAYHQAFVDSGFFGVYVGCLPAKTQTVLSICREQLDHVAEQGLDTAAFARSKGQLIGSTVLNQEDSSARMTRIGKAALYGEPILTIPEVMSHIDGVTAGEVHEVATTILRTTPRLAVIGPFASADEFTSVA